MLFCSDLLFLHVPRTAGMSMTRRLIHVLPRPTWYVAEQLRRRLPDGVIAVEGLRHATLAEASAIVATYGFALSDFPLIIVAIRDPYDLEVSRYAHLQKGLPHQTGLHREIARTADFETFARETKTHSDRPTEDYFLLDGHIPENLVILRFENVAAEFQRALSQIGIGDASLPDAANASWHGHYTDYYTPAAEEAVYRKYRWVFDNGFYERREFAAERAR